MLIHPFSHGCYFGLTLPTRHVSGEAEQVVQSVKEPLKGSCQHVIGLRRLAGACAPFDGGRAGSLRMMKVLHVCSPRSLRIKDSAAVVKQDVFNLIHRLQRRRRHVLAPDYPVFRKK